MMIDWYGELSSAITITDEHGVIVYMNNKSADTFANDGGRSLVGSDLKDCHNAVSNEIIKQIVETLKPNIYTIEKKGKKKLIYQAPWFKDGKYSGLVELSIELPENMPHFNRD